ncbi:MAG: Pseudouridine synthase [Microgenomates group bacterium GW2011_GWF2_45_18]|nr:MAG: Pseudouridine synthase [Microgenomates group bacterium GW2011_GWF1_44_10]KKU01796.1 MAG: Pseudouridine synthase [Microgenomates group bacterium GW2011_GWF2_45_18]OGJ41273.1 MAG: hypothetical protein A2378_04240 [Candidatus Pacebacteria bacterium RIFOXYB1_FULL_44_10]HAU98900.1 hypothetical protein [Candidatus Paceibacterota bacterium]HAX01143.1 hypothetical protein [Candidatus Paceibacterota bacterium]
MNVNVTKLAPKILFENELLLVIEKPAGVVVNRASTVREETIQDWCERREWFPKQVETEEGAVYQQRSGMAHRIDRDTSGCLLIAKNPTTLFALMKQFQDRTVHKEYLALVHGVFGARAGTIALPLARSQTNRQSYTVDPSGKVSETDYVVMKEYAVSPEQTEGIGDAGLSYVRVMPRTGRTHQIRAHMKYLHHPLVSDVFYGSGRRLQNDLLWCPRLFLHAEKIEFINPETKQRVQVVCELAEDLRRVMEVVERVNTTKD